LCSVARVRGVRRVARHKNAAQKSPNLIPILDNRAIFGAYMNERWGPSQPSPDATIKSVARIREALVRIAYDLTRPENSRAWSALHEQEPQRTRIELFDCVWWIYFRQVEPVPSKSTTD
jgi:hypothetical protein